MKKAFLLVVVLASGLPLFGQKNIPMVKFDKIDQILNAKQPKIIVVNFWATWCAPCVKELPLFDALEEKKNPEVKIYLVSLDFADNLSKVEAFAARKKLKPEVILLDEIDYDSWIDKVDPSWEGPIPATLVLNTQTGQRKFVAKELGDGELEDLVREISTQ